MKNLAKFITVFKKVWKDPVWSKVISAGIIFLFGTLWLKYIDYSLAEVINLANSTLSISVPFYFFLALIVLFLIVRGIIRIFKKKEDPVWNEQIGNFTFGELYRIMENQRVPVRTQSMKWAGKEPPQENLLMLFAGHYLHLNMGVSQDTPIDDGGYLVGVLCPLLLGYGLVDKYEITGQYGITINKYQTSALGHKFHSLLEKVRFLTIRS